MWNPIILIPAYGRKAEDTLALLADWHAGRDFRDWRGTTGYCSIRDLPELTYMTSSITLVDPVTRASLVVWKMGD